MDKNKIEFEEYDVEFKKDEFKKMSKKDLEECDEILKKIEKIMDNKKEDE